MNDTIRRACRADSGLLAMFGVQLFGSSSVEELEVEFSELTEDANTVCFLKYADGQPVGFAQCQLRHDYVEGTKTAPVGYLEGVFVLPQYRNNGYAAELLSCCEQWARERGCTEFASDCELTNDASFRFHIAAGFEEVNRIICFKKRI